MIGPKTISVYQLNKRDSLIVVAQLCPEFTARIVDRWRTIAALAKCDDLHFHDLRHEATSRIYERTTFTDLQIAKITGHNDLKSLRRYANLRASSLAGGMW